MNKYKLLYALALSCITTVLPAQLKDYSFKVDSVLNLMTLQEKVGQMIQYSNNKLLTGPALDSSNRTEEIKRGEVGSVFNIITVERAKQYQDLAMQSRLRIPLLFGLDVLHGDLGVHHEHFELGASVFAVFGVAAEGDCLSGMAGEGLGVGVALVHGDFKMLGPQELQHSEGLFLGQVAFVDILLVEGVMVLAHTTD